MKKRGLVSPDRLDAIVLACSSIEDAAAYLDLLEKILCDPTEDEEYLTEKERMDRRAINWLLGGDLEPPMGQEGDMPIIGEKRSVAVITKLDRNKEGD